MNYEPKIYNGVGHELNLYLNKVDYYLNRRNEYFLTCKNAMPQRIIKK